MNRLVFVLLLLPLGAATSPEVRVALESYAARALDPVYVWSTRSRLGSLGRALQSERTAEPPASDSALAVYVRDRFRGSDTPHLDPWGTPFFLVREAFATRIASAGPDRSRGTADDIQSPPY